MISSVLYNIKRSLINAYCILIDFIVLFARRVEKPNTERKKILIIKTDNIGDFILWTDVAKEYKKIFPPEAYEITLLGNSMWTSLAAKTYYFDHIIPLNRKKFILHPFYRIQKMKEVISLKWHKVIYHSFSHEFSTGLSILKLIKSEQVIAAPSDNVIDTAYWRTLVQKKLNFIPAIADTEIHELKRNAAFIKSLGHTQFVDSIPDLRFLSAQVAIKLPETYYVIFPGASSPARQWGESNFIELCNYIYEMTGWTGILCGGRSEIHLAEAILKNSKAKLISLAGKTSLEEFLTILEKSLFVVTNETSCTHMAASVNATTLCLLGGGHFGRFLPFPYYENRKSPQSIYYKMDCFNCNWNCKFRPTKFQAAPCVENISLTQVIQIVKVIIEEKLLTPHAK